MQARQPFKHASLICYFSSSNSGFCRGILNFFFRRRANLHEGNNSKNFCSAIAREKNYTGFVKVNEAKVVCGCASASCIELVADGVQWRNFAIKVKILQVLVMTRNFHNNSKEDFVPYWSDVAVTGVHVILILTSLLSGLMRH